MERNEIIKALECCFVNSNCNGCPLDRKTDDCLHFTGVSAIAVIKELTEENERLENALIEQSAENVMLIGENKRLRACTNLIPTLNEVKADTVREMQERLKAHLEKPEFPWDSFTVAEEVIDQIAKEMLEGEK